MTSNFSESGERLNRERFYKIREESPSTIIVGHGMKEPNVTAAVAHPGVMIASDGMIYHEGRAHPRGAGTYCRVLGYYVRELGALSLMDALGKMSYLPAARLENVVDQMKRKGRIAVGADADIVVFDPQTVRDRATFNEPALPSVGMAHVLVNGVAVVRDGVLQEGVLSGPRRPPDDGRKMMKKLLIASLFLVAPAFSVNASAAEYDIVITNGRVMNPESGLDAIRNVGISKGRIEAISREPLSGDRQIDAAGLVIAPGFIDLHAHGQHEFASRLQAQDGVTTQLEMEGGVYPVGPWYEARQAEAVINFGATVGHIGLRSISMIDLEKLGITEQMLRDAAGNQGLDNEYFQIMARERTWVDDHPSREQLDEMLRRGQEGIDEGAIGIGYGIAYTPGATREEIFRMFSLAQRNGLVNFVHMRNGRDQELGGNVDATQEVIANSAATGADAHIVHIGSSGGNRIGLLLEMIDNARANGIPVTTEVYPYTAWSTFIGAALFDGNWTELEGMEYSDIELPQTGERLNEESFLRIRKERPDTVIVGHGMKEHNVTRAVAHPGVMIASDGMVYVNGRAHPRGAGTFSRVLGRYVREKQALSLMSALGKMSYLPARLLQNSVPQMARKGRISVGADADLVIFDPATVSDQATFAEPALPSTGIHHVLVHGSPIVENGRLIENQYPGKAVRRGTK